ncbi:MAG: helix-turn-helix domain-containing protein [Janthinobacterium lividum]
METTRWADLAHKATPEEMAIEKSEAIAELERMGYGALRKARSLTQVELAGRLNISQASVAALEGRTDLHLSTLAKYIRALGGELEIRAVFPEATFNLEPPAMPEGQAPAKARPVRAGKRIAAIALKQSG